MNRFSKFAPNKQIHLPMIRYNIFRRLSSLVRNVLTTRWSLLEGNFCTSKAVSHNLTSYKNNKSKCFALQVALSHLDHFLSVLFVLFQARWCPATVTLSSVRLTPGTVASVSLPWSTCPTTKCSTWWVSYTPSSHPSSSRPERSRTPGPTWTHTQASSSSTTEWKRWTITQSYSVSAELWVSWASSTYTPHGLS